MLELNYNCNFRKFKFDKICILKKFVLWQNLSLKNSKIFDASWQSLHFCDKIYIFLPKFSFFTKIFIFYQNFHFLPKFAFFPKICIFSQNFHFLPKFSICDKNFNFWQNFQFLTKFSIFDKIFNFWQNFQFLTNVSRQNHFSGTP